MAWTVFISSTFTDLKEHRAAAVRALRDAGFHPIDMIHFMARPEGATDACLAEVAAAELFIGIYAHRYGHIPENSQIGITEQEFEEARRLGKPCFCFVVDESHPWPESERETGEKAEKLSAFKSRIDRTLVRSAFTTPADLAVKVLASLKRWELRNVPKAAPDSRATRPENEAILLRRVEEAWIDGVLKNALHHEVMIQLEKESSPGAVEAMRDMFCRPLVFSDKETSSLPGEIDKVFEASGRALLVLGAPGSGKTVTLLELAQRLIETAKADPSAPVPVVLNLSSWSDRFSGMGSWIAEEIFRSYRIPRKIAYAWVAEIERHPLVFLLDGLDEVKPSFQGACAVAINQFRESHGLSGVAVACREADYEAIAEKLHLETAARIRPLSVQKIMDFVDALGQRVASLKIALEMDPALLELARSPLMLGIMTLAYQGTEEHPLPQDKGTGLENRRKRLFNAYIAKMLTRRKSQAGFKNECTLGYLRWLAKRMKAQSLSVFHIENIQPFWLNSRKEVAEYLALSRLLIGSLFLTLWILLARWLDMMEHTIPSQNPTDFYNFFLFFLRNLFIFTICLSLLDFFRIEFWTKKPNPSHSQVFFFLLRQAYCILLALILGSLTWMAWSTEETTNAFLSRRKGWTFYMAQIIIYFSLRRSNLPFQNDISSIEGVRWSPKDFFGFFLLIGIMIFFFIIGFAPPLAESILIGKSQKFAIFFWFIPALFISLLASLRFDGIEKKKTRANQGIHMSFRNASILAFSFGSLSFFAAAIVPSGKNSFLDPLIFGFIIAGYAGLWYGGIDVIQHYSLRIILWGSRNGPWRYTDFLEDATQRLLLRRVGGGYIFLHRLLLEHFASMKKTGL